MPTPRWSGSTSTAISTATASSSISGARRKDWPTRAGRIRGTPTCIAMARWRRRRWRRVEVQGYVYDAKSRMSSLLRTFGDVKTADRLKREAADLARRFDRAFWMPSRGFYAMALDAEKKPLEVISSNPGHLLFTRIIGKERARVVVESPYARRHVQRLGLAHHVAGRACLQSAQLPSRLGLAARQLAHRAWHGRQRNARGRAQHSDLAVSGGVRTSATIACRSCSVACSAASTTSRCTIPFPAHRRRGRRARCS